MGKLESSTILIAAGFLVLAGISVAQYRSLSLLRSEVRQLQGVEVRETVRIERERSPGTVVRVEQEGSAAGRLMRLEQTVEQLTRAAEHLMERGAIPLNAEKAQALQVKFLNASLADTERLQALRVLRRNQGVTDEILLGTINWLQSTTNGVVKRELLEQMRGVTNQALKQPLLSLVANDQPPRVRAEAVQRLQQYVDDPAVEEKLWQMAMGDNERGVREEALEVLVEGNMPESRVNAFKALALDPQATMEVKMTALEALRRARVESPEIMGRFAEMANQSSDPNEKARLFRAFDGMRDETLKAPLVYGLQDASPNVRQQAADALSGFNQDPVVQQWLRYVGENDADARVRREALEALEENQSRNRGNRNRERE